VVVRALVIGIDSYAPASDPTEPGSGPGALDNAVSDATAMHEMLQRLPGAASTLLTDCGKAQMEQALKDFRDSAGTCKGRGMRVTAAAAAGAGGAAAAGTLGLVFFAGHGISLGNANYLLPADWRVPHANRDVHVMEEDAAEAAVPLSAVEKMLSRTAMFAGCVLLDCCRNVPDFKVLADEAARKTRGAGGGRPLLAGLAPPGKTLDDLLVIFATAMGARAEDASRADPGHSPFTSALLQTLPTPGLPLRELPERLTDAVKSDSGGAFRPASCTAMQL